MHVSGKGKGIKELDLGKVFSTPQAQESLALVKSLDLSYNSLCRVDALHPLASLVVLDLSHNKISAVANLPRTLQRLSLQYNQLTSLGGGGGRLGGSSDVGGGGGVGILDLPCLEYLDVSFNQITSLHRLPPTMPLQVLLADNNTITSIAGGSPSSPSSTNTSLLVANNERSTKAMSSNLAAMKTLRMVSLNNNLIRSIAEVGASFGPLPLLEALSMDGNPLTQINGYRGAVLRAVRGLATLDGTAVAREEADESDGSSTDYNSDDSRGDEGEAVVLGEGHRHQTVEQQPPHRRSGPERAVSRSGQQPSPQQIAASALRRGGVPTNSTATAHNTIDTNNTINNTSRIAASFDGGAASSSQHRHPHDALKEQLHSQHDIIATLRRSLRDTLQKYQLECEESALLRRKLTEVSTQLSDARRIISQQLDTIAMLKAERDAAVEGLRRASDRLVKQSHDAAYAVNTARATARTAGEALERERVRGMLSSQFGGGGESVAGRAPNTSLSSSSSRFRSRSIDVPPTMNTQHAFLAKGSGANSSSLLSRRQLGGGAAAAAARRSSSSATASSSVAPSSSSTIITGGGGGGVGARRRPSSVSTTASGRPVTLAFGRASIKKEGGPLDAPGSTINSGGRPYAAADSDDYPSPTHHGDDYDGSEAAMTGSAVDTSYNSSSTVKGPRHHRLHHQHHHDPSSASLAAQLKSWMISELNTSASGGGVPQHTTNTSSTLMTSSTNTSTVGRTMHH